MCLWMCCIHSLCSRSWSPQWTEAWRRHTAAVCSSLSVVSKRNAEHWASLYGELLAQVLYTKGCSCSGAIKSSSCSTGNRTSTATTATTATTSWATLQPTWPPAAWTWAGWATQHTVEHKLIRFTVKNKVRDFLNQTVGLWKTYHWIQQNHECLLFYSEAAEGPGSSLLWPVAPPVVLDMKHKVKK